MGSVEDYRELARSKTKDEFVALCPHGFLIGIPSLQKPNAPGRTMMMGVLDRSLLTNRNKRPSGDATLVILPVRKVQESFPSMITVGRTANNDVVIEDVQVSKFHAIFRLTATGAELSDAGSRNGTFVRQRKLEPKGVALQVRSGDPVRFGTLEFTYLDAATAWERLR